MERHTLAAMALASFVSSAAFAQTVLISPEQEIVIREYVTTHRVAPVDVTGVELVVGATLPQTVELHRLDVPDVSYSYVVVDGRTLIVEPETRKVVHIVGL